MKHTKVGGGVMLMLKMVVTLFSFVAFLNISSAQHGYYSSSYYGGFSSSNMENMIYISHRPWVWTGSDLPSDQPRLPRQTGNHQQITRQAVRSKVVLTEDHYIKVTNEGLNLEKQKLLDGQEEQSEVQELSKIGDEATDDSCSICLTEFNGGQNLVQINCGSEVPHVFCEDCIQKAVKVSQKLRCPICRRTIKQRSKSQENVKKKSFIVKFKESLNCLTKCFQ